MNILLTGVKFLLYYVSGSMAILAEAWHSFTDIATSLLVFFGVRRSVRGKEEKEAEGAEAEPARDEGPKRASLLEVCISLGIGLLLLCVAVVLLRRAIYAEPRVIRNALTAGLLFILFSLGSYFISYFEIRIGKREGSVGLVSDGMHARADMVSSLLTGFALILYFLGWNIDRWVAGLIALLILSFSVETIFNVVRAYVLRDTGELFRYKSYQIVGLMMERENLRKGSQRILSFLEDRLGRTRFMRGVYRILPAVPILLIVGGYVSTAFYSVGMNEQAVVERFGKPVSREVPVGPGLHLKLPWPVDRVQTVKTAYIDELNIGNVTDRGTLALLWTRKHGTEEPFLSGDNNFFYPYIVLHYRIKDIFQYLYRNKDPRALIDEAAHRIATLLFARESYYRIAASHRARLEQALLHRLQAALDDLECGVELVTVNFKDIHPPIPVADSFEKVIAGYQEKQQIINQARGYENRVKPEGRGKAYQQGEEAESYIVDRTKRAEGEAARFALSVPGSAEEKAVTMSRIYLKTVEETLKYKTKIVVDPKAGEPEVWMDFENIFPGSILGGP
jgi:membrane protease subunit HflK